MRVKLAVGIHSLVPKLQLGNAPVPEALLHYLFVFNSKQ